jgi:FlaA1/EpsC-like NDP-sugar epimerase
MVLTFLFRFQDYSRVIFIIDWLLLLFLVSGVRVLIRIQREYFSSLNVGGKKVLIIGAGDTGELLLREIKHNKSLNLKVVGFIDDDINKIGRRIHGTPILGDRNRIPQFVREKNINEILIAIPSAERKNLEDIFRICADCNVTYREIGGILRKNE